VMRDRFSRSGRPLGKYVTVRTRMTAGPEPKLMRPGSGARGVVRRPGLRPKGPEGIAFKTSVQPNRMLN